MHFSIIIVIASILLGCSQKEMKAPNQNAIFSAHATSTSIEDAKNRALAELASNIQVTVSESFNLQESSSANKTTRESKRTISNSSKLRLKYVEFSDVQTQSHLFSDDIYSINAYLTYKSLDQYIKDFTQRRALLGNKISSANNSVRIQNKDRYITQLASDIQHYNNALTILLALDETKGNFYINESKHSLNKKINALPLAKFKFKSCATPIYKNCLIQFSSQVKDDDMKHTYFWDFGDNSTSTKAHPKHTYKSVGRFNVQLSAIDPNYNVAQYSQYIDVINLKPKASFFTEDALYSLFDEVEFVNTSKDIDGKIISYLWNFGNGYTSNKKNPTHQYEVTGTYKVTLTVTDNNQQESSTHKTIIVKHPVELDIKKGMNLRHLKLLLGKPEDSIDKSFSSVKAFLYHRHWVLIENDIVQCVVQTEGFETTLGYPADCAWYSKHNSKYLLQQ